MTELMFTELEECIKYQIPEIAYSDVAEILAVNYGYLESQVPWYWVVRLHDNRFALVYGSNFENWGDQSTGEIFFAETAEEACYLQDYVKYTYMLLDQLKNGVHKSHRENDKWLWNWERFSQEMLAQLGAELLAKKRRERNKLKTLQDELEVVKQHMDSTKDLRWSMVKVNLELQINLLQELIND